MILTIPPSRFYKLHRVILVFLYQKLLFSVTKFVELISY
jgi:hypothetical protein